MAAIRSQGSVMPFRAASLRSRFVVSADRCAPKKSSVPSIEPGKVTPTDSIMSQNSAMTSSQVSRSTSSIPAISCASSACNSGGRRDRSSPAPSASITRTTTAAFCRGESPGAALSIRAPLSRTLGEQPARAALIFGERPHAAPKTRRKIVSTCFV